MFSREGRARGRRGPGQVTTTTFSVPAGSLDWWAHRLRRAGCEADREADQAILRFSDPDGLQLALVGTSDDPRPAWEEGPVGSDQAIRGLHSVALTVADAEPTAALLIALGLRQIGDGAGGRRFAAAAGDRPGALLDLLEAPEPAHGVAGSGTVHHVAWRTADDGTQHTWRERLLQLGREVTPIRDRQYFRSIYFREPGGVLFEIATEQPGFAVDEAPASLGTMLKLPPWAEPERARFEASLPAVVLPPENNPALPG